MKRVLALAHVSAVELMTGSPRHLSRRGRGATMLEYAILAGIVVVIGGLALTLLRGPFEGLFSRVGDTLNNAGK